MSRHYDFDVIVGPDEEPAATQPDSQTQAWKDRQAKDLGELEIKGLEYVLAQRETYAKWLFRVFLIWLALVLGAVYLQAWNLAGFELSDGVLIALLTTSTATIVGVILVVARFLFPEDGP